MNRFTLKFLDSKLEENYQNYENNTKRFPMFFSLSIAATILDIVQMVLNLVNGKEFNMILQIVFLVYVVTSVPCIYKKKDYSQIALGILNIFLMLNQFSLDSDYTTNTACNYGQSIMIIHSIVGFISDFYVASLQILILVVISLMSTLTNSEQIQPKSIYISFVASIFFVVVRYKLDSINRQRYYLTLKDSQWEQILPKIIQKPFMLFNFNSIKFQFELRVAGKLIFNCLNNEHLIQFLRAAKFRKESLEQYIFKQNQKLALASPLNEYSRTMIIEYHKRKHKIFYSQFYLTGHLFLIVFDDEQLKIKLLQQKYENQEKANQNVFYKFLNRNCKLLNEGIHYRHFNSLKKLRYISTVLLLRKLMNKPQAQVEEKVNILKIMKFVKSLHYDHNIEIEGDVNSKCSTIKSNFILLLLEVIQQIISKTIEINYYQMENEELIITIRGVKGKPQHSLNEDYGNLLQQFKCYTDERGYCVFLHFYDNPLISFSPLKSKRQIK